MATRSIEANLALLAEDRALSDKAAEASIRDDKVFRRKWVGIDPFYAEKLANALRNRTSVKNPDDDDRYYSVVNPMVDKIERPGTWRGVKVEWELDEPGRNTATIYQTLAYGWAKTFVDAEARWTAGMDRPIEPERQVERQYVNLDPFSLDTMLDLREATEYVVDPTAQGIALTGNYRVKSRVPSVAQDGSGIITETLIKGWVKTPDSLPTAVLLTDDKLLLSPFAHDTTSVDNGYVHEYRGIDPDYAQTLRNTISLLAGVIDAKIVKAEDGSCSIQVLTQTKTWAGDLSDQWAVSTTFPTFNAEEVINTYRHIPIASVDGHLTTLGTAPTGYVVTNLTHEDDDQGAATISQRLLKKFSTTPSATNGTDVENTYLQFLASGVIVKTVWINVPDDLLAAALTTLGTPPAGYTVLNVGDDYNGRGVANIQRTMITMGSATQVEMRVDWPSFDSERHHNYYFGLSNSDALTLYATLETTPTLGYKVDSVAMMEGIAGSITLVQVETKCLDVPEEADKILTGTETIYWSNSDRITHVFLHVKDGQLDTAMTTLSTPPAGYTLVSIRNNAAGTGSCDIERICIKANTTGFLAEAQWPDFEGEINRLYYFGYNYTDGIAKFALLQTTLPSGYAAATWKIDAAGMQEGPHGTITLSQQVSKCMSDPAEDDKVQIALETDYWGNSDRLTHVWLKVKDEDLEDAITTLSTPPDGYTVAYVRHAYAGTGSANIERMIVKKNSTGFLAEARWPDFEGEIQTFIYFGYNYDDAQTLLGTLQTTLPAGYASTAWKIDAASESPGPFNTVTLTQVISKTNVTSSTTSAVRAVSYTPSFGLVSVSTTIYLNVQKAGIATVKAAIVADVTKIVLSTEDNDRGQGAADITVRWRSKPSSVTALGVLEKSVSSPYRPATKRKLWIDINLTDSTSLATAVAAAVAGTGDYAPDATEAIIGAVGTDNGDKTGRIEQHTRDNDPSTTPPAYTVAEGLDIHGFYPADLERTVYERPSVLPADVATVYAELKALVLVDGKVKGQIRCSFDPDAGRFHFIAVLDGTPSWDNTTPEWQLMGQQNPSSSTPSHTYVAYGVPLTSCATVAGAVTATSGWQLDAVEVRELGEGRGSVLKEETQADGTAVETGRGGGYGNVYPFIETTWHKVLPANVAGVYAVAASYNVSGTYVLAERAKIRLDSGFWQVQNRVVSPTTSAKTDCAIYSDDSVTDAVVERISLSAAPSGTAVAYLSRRSHYGVNQSVGACITDIENAIASDGDTYACTSHDWGKYGWYVGILYYWWRATCVEKVSSSTNWYDAKTGAAILAA